MLRPWLASLHSALDDMRREGTVPPARLDMAPRKSFSRNLELRLNEALGNTISDRYCDVSPSVTSVPHGQEKEPELGLYGQRNGEER